jgi:2-succinyl-5-enolpyruvyl-6-hydroxy-3-cyclohexene-1-carboxylate synthase
VSLRVLANRGANGIDGIVSSALGVAAASGRPTVLLTGDLAFLHDVGGLLTASRHQVPLTVVVVNNDGGGIFSFLPIAKATDQFEALFGTPHGVDLSHAAALYGGRFHRPESASALRTAVQQGLEGGLHLIEVRTDRTRNVEEHRRLFSRMADALGPGPWA